MFPRKFSRISRYFLLKYSEQENPSEALGLEEILSLPLPVPTKEIFPEGISDGHCREAGFGWPSHSKDILKTPDQTLGSG